MSNIKVEILRNTKATELAGIVQLYRNQGYRQVGNLIGTPAGNNSVEYAVLMEKEEHPGYMRIDPSRDYEKSPDQAEAKQRHADRKSFQLGETYEVPR